MIPPQSITSIRKHCEPADKDAEQVNLGRKYLSNIQKYMELKEQKSQHDGESKRLEEKMKEAYAEIVEAMGTSCTAVIKDGGKEYVLSYNPLYRTGIDQKGLERLKAQHPNVYDDYVNTTESRRFKAVIVCGSRISSGMRGEIELAGKLHIPVYAMLEGGGMITLVKITQEERMDEVQVCKGNISE